MGGGADDDIRQNAYLRDGGDGSDEGDVGQKVRLDLIGSCTRDVPLTYITFITDITSVTPAQRLVTPERSRSASLR
jgi:hypothetical protein